MKAIRKTYLNEQLKHFRVLDVPEEYTFPYSSSEAEEMFMSELKQPHLGSNESISLMEDNEVPAWLEHMKARGYTDDDSDLGIYELK